MNNRPSRFEEGKSLGTAVSAGIYDSDVKLRHCSWWLAANRSWLCTAHPPSRKARHWVLIVVVLLHDQALNYIVWGVIDG